MKKLLLLLLSISLYGYGNEAGLQKFPMTLVRSKNTFPPFIKSKSEIEFSHQTNPYHTHQPVLHHLAMTTTGPIIEFGCGYGSTVLLHEICKKEKRLLISLDDNWEWFHLFQEKYKEDEKWHRFIFVPGKPSEESDSHQHWIDFIQQSDLFETYDFDLCFIDQDPWLARYVTLLHMKDRAKFVVMHDCDYFPTQNIFGSIVLPSNFNEPGIFDFSDLFRAFKVFYPLAPWPGWTGPPTLVGSNIIDVPEVDFHHY